jgi:hypothetical protein
MSPSTSDHSALPFSDWLGNGLGMSTKRAAEKEKWNHGKIREVRTESNLFGPNTVKLWSVGNGLGMSAKRAMEKEKLRHGKIPEVRTGSNLFRPNTVKMWL